MAFTLGIFAHTTLGPCFAYFVGIGMLFIAAGFFVDALRNLTQSHPEAVFRNATSTRATNENSTAIFILQEKIINLLKISNTKETRIEGILTKSSSNNLLTSMNP